jgi:peroxiredoxin
MSAASGSTNMPDPSAPDLSAGDKISAFSLPDTNGSLVSSTILLEQGPLIVTFYRGIWCP